MMLSHGARVGKRPSLVEEVVAGDRREGVCWVMAQAPAMALYLKHTQVPAAWMQCRRTLDQRFIG